LRATVDSHVGVLGVLGGPWGFTYFQHPTSYFRINVSTSTVGEQRSTMKPWHEALQVISSIPHQQTGFAGQHPAVYQTCHAKSISQLFTSCFRALFDSSAKARPVKRQRYCHQFLRNHAVDNSPPDLPMRPLARISKDSKLYSGSQSSSISSRLFHALNAGNKVCAAYPCRLVLACQSPANLLSSTKSLWRVFAAACFLSKRQDLIVRFDSCSCITSCVGQGM